MEALTGFIQRFTDKTVEDLFNTKDVVELKKEYFLADRELCELNKGIEKININLKAKSIGVYLGGIRKGNVKAGEDKFQPSLALLEMISKVSSKKIFLNRKVEWLFLCGKDVFEDSIVRPDKQDKKSNKHLKKGDSVLVQTKDDENLGYGQVVKQGKVFLKNLLDRGDFLRRERKR